MRFIFKARNQKGEIEKGKVEAVNEELALKVLRDNKLVPISVTREEDVPKIIRDLQRSWEGASKKDLVIFFRQLQALISAKVPLTHSLRSIEDQLENNYIKNIVKEISNDIDDGVAFSDAMEKYPEVFSKITSSTIRAGEISGNMEKSIQYVADNLDKSYRLTSKIRGALLYPVFVLVAAGAIGFLSLTLIVPKLTSVIQEMGLTIPWYTQALILLGDFMQNYWWAVLIVIIAAVLGIMYYISTGAGKREWDRIQLEIPIFGKLLKYVYLTRFAGNLSMLLNGGIPIVQSLAIVSDVVNNSVYSGIILRSADEVKSGGNMSNVLFKTKHMPAIVSRMVKVGEETGKLDESLENVAIFYEQEIDDIVRNMTALIEPILIIFLGMGVALL
ncbi:MAG: type II secretion system F family protein, partial [Candidatus Moranbacteria bacterium]|nr:type II secretion system F family protein [Candidatus Moranbacteria bacterium]